jgi:hypothetical protein
MPTIKKTLPQVIILVAIVLSAVSNANAQSLWGKAEYGMTPEQVKNIAPSVTSSSTPQQLDDGSKGLLRNNAVRLLNKFVFSADYFFKDGKLNQIVLNLEEPHNLDSALVIFDSIKEALRALFGPEDDNSEEQIEGMYYRITATWADRKRTIDMRLIKFTENNAELNIRFQEKASDEDQ